MELCGRGLEAEQAGGPGRGDETDRAPHADRRIGDDHVEPILLERVVGHRDRQRDGGHVEAHVQQHHPEHLFRIGDVRDREQHHRAADLQHAVQAFGIDPLVRHDADQRGHEQRGDAHGREDRAEAGTRPVLVLEPPGADGQQPRAPDVVLEEIEYGEAELEAHGRGFPCKAGVGPVATMS